MQGGRRAYGPAADTKAEARAKLNAKLEAARNPKPKRIPTFSEFYYAQMPRLKKELSPTTYALYETVYETLVREKPIAVVKLDKLEPADVQYWLSSLQGLKPRSAWRYLQCIKAILEYAHRTRLIPHNPAAPIRPPKVEEHEKRVLDKESLEELLRLAMTARMRTAILLCAHGLRRAEACGLRHEDFDGAGIEVRRQALEVNGEAIIREATKTGGRRWVPVSGELKALLASGEGYVLKTSSGKPLRPRNMAREWTALVKGTAFEGMTLHDLRSSFGMLLLEKGVDVRTASEILGHSPAMLAKIYARSRKDLKAEALAKVFA
jgi:integrase/recombinase XerC